MTKRTRVSAPLRERVQVHLAPDDRDLLNRLAEETGLSKAEILRRGVRSFARAQRGATSMLRFLAETSGAGWPKAVAVDHDAVLAQAYRAPVKKRR